MIEEIFKIYKVITFKRGKKRIYEVSNYGNVKVDGILVEPRIHVGYKYIAGFHIHRAVAELFIPNEDNKPQIDHIDTNRLNNVFTNLRWCTQGENNRNPITVELRKNSNIGKTRTEETRTKMKHSHKKMRDTSKVGKSTLGRHRVYDNINKKIYHYE